MAWRNTWATIWEPYLESPSPGIPVSERAWLQRTLGVFVRAVHKFLEHGDLFSSAAISFYALFSVLPLLVLFLVGLQLFFPYAAVLRNVGRLFGLAGSDLFLKTVRDAYAQQGTLGWAGVVTLIVAATGVFSAVQVALDRVWESRGRTLHLRFLIGALTMAASLLIFLGMLLGTVYAFRLIRMSLLGAWLGWPRVPARGTSNALTIATVLAQFGIFWTGYRFLPSVPVRWRDALPGAAVAALMWHAIAYGLSWYLGSIADYATFYHQLGVVVALLVWVYGLSASFLLGAEIVAQRTQWPQGRGGAQWRQPVGPPIPEGQGARPGRQNT